MAKLRPKSFPYTRGGEDLANQASNRIGSVASQRRANTREGAYKNYSASKNSYPDQVRPISTNTRGNLKMQPQGKSSFPDYAGITNERQGHRASMDIGRNVPGYGGTNFKTPGTPGINAGPVRSPGSVNSGQRAINNSLGPPTEGETPEDWGFDNTVKPPIRNVPGAGPQPGMSGQKPGPGVDPEADPGDPHMEQNYVPWHGIIPKGKKNIR